MPRTVKLRALSCLQPSNHCGRMCTLVKSRDPFGVIWAKHHELKMGPTDYVVVVFCVVQRRAIGLTNGC